VVDIADRALPNCDSDVSSAMLDNMREAGITVALKSSVRFDEDETSSSKLRVQIHPMGAGAEKRSDAVGGGDGGRCQWIQCDTFLSATGRVGNTDHLGLDTVGIAPERDGRIPVQPTSLWTGVGRIYAAGDVAGNNEIRPNGLVTTGQAQAMRAVYTMHINEWPGIAFRADFEPHIPCAIWTMPDVAYVGPTEAEARARYGAGAVGCSRAEYDLTVRNAVTPRAGFVKLVFLLDGGRVLACHLLGEDANEMVHYGALVVNEQHTVFDVVKEVMAGVTYQECYRFAALEACMQVSTHVARL
jgi:pyruvate/2-oxoglutarate dehydrogenase complex dihydrolipoamide dehydrogenase (E3) component